MGEIGKKLEMTVWFPTEYFLATFGFAWLCWLPGILATEGILDLPVPWGAFHLLGIFGPLVGALWSVARQDGLGAASRLLARILDVRVRMGWLAVILLLPVLLPALALWLFRQMGGDIPDLEVMSKPWVLLPAILFMALIGGGQEEFGWRGYALDILQARWGAVIASLVLGFIWGIWHLPLFFIEYTGQYYMPMWVFILASPAMSILTTWIYNSTGKKLFAAWLFHGVINAGLDAFLPIQKIVGGDQRAFVIVCGLYSVVAIIVIAVFGRHQLGLAKAIVQNEVRG